jgi:hypothetical protein
MSSLTTTTINTKDGLTNLTVRTGNTSGPSIIVNAIDSIVISANNTANVFIANTTGVRVNTSASVASTLTVSANVNAQANLYVSGNAEITGVLNGSNATMTGRITATSANVSTNTFNFGASSIANPGYSRLPNGLLMQWGNASVNSSSGSVTFPAAFTSVYSMQLTPSVSTVGNTLPAVTALTATTATLRSANATASTVYWLAIGT